MKKKRVMGRIRYKSAAIKLKKAVAVLMAALMMGSAVDYTALPAACAAEDVTGEQVAELTQDGKTTVYSSFMEAYQAITTSDKATIKLLQDSRISKITGSKYITYITDKEHTIVLDLNGHTLSTEEVSGWDSKESTYVLDIDTSSNWTICSGVPGGKIQDSGSKAALLENYGTLAIGGNVEITSNSEYTVFARGGTGNLSIDGAAIDKVGVMYGSCKITSGNIDNVFWRGGKAEISGGKIGTVSVIGDYAGWSKGSNLQLCGGTIGLLKQREEYTKAMSTWFAAGTAIKSIEGGSLYTRAGIDAIEAVEGYRCAENIEMVPCGNHVNESGYCMYCAAATECEHIYGEDGICTNCGMVAIATIKKDNQLTGYITYGELCQAVSEFTPDTTATIKIIKDVDLNQSLAFREGKITLDLGGHKIETARVNTVIVSDHAEVTIQNGTLKTREKDVVRAEGGKLTLEKSTTVSSSDYYYYYYAGLRIDGGEVTIDGAGFVDGERSVDITGGNLTVLDGTFSGQFRKYFYNGEESPEVFLRGGSYSDVRSLKGNLRSMLENGYGFRSREEGTAWIVDSDLLDGEGAGEDTAKIVSNVTVEKLPVTITQPESYEDYCGNPASLYVNVDAAEEVTYQWYRITGEGNAEEISDATSNTLQISPLEFQPGVGITFYCMIYWQGYSIKSEEATVTLKEKIDFYVNTAIEKYYTGEAVTLQEDEISLYLKDGSVNNTLVPGKDFKIVEGSYEHNTDATTQDKMASVTVEGIGKYKGTVQVRFSILQAENEFTGELTCEDYVYDGVAVPNPEAAAKFGTVKYRYAASETGEYTDVVPKSAGIYYVKAYVTETNNYTGLESREAAKFVVFKAKQPENTPKDSITTPYTAKKVSQVELPADWQWVEEDASKDLPESEAVEAKADYAGQDKDLYITKQVTITITRSACEHPDTKVKGEEASTCTTAGYTGDTYCEQCGRKIKEGKEIALLPHILEKIEKKNATTVKEGNIEYYHCSVCDGCFSDSEGTSPITKESTVIPVIKVTPTVTPTAAPSAKPTTEPGVEPTETPGAEPGVEPTAVPSAEPGVEPTAVPSAESGVKPTAGPSAEPGVKPTAVPSAEPGVKPTAVPSAEPGVEPTAGPSAEPGAEPTAKPTAEPTETPGAEPTAKPTAGSTAEPGGKPTAGPSEETTAKPGGKPTAEPSVSPAAEPTVTPSAAPTETPAGEPAIPKPTKKPVVKPAKKGKKLTGSKGAIYKVTSDKKGSPTVEYSAAAKGAKGTITIPAQVTIKGVTYKVTSVGASACRNRAGITKVIIGKNVKKIGNRVFSGCKKLKKVTIKTTKLTESTVGSNAFSGISSGVVVKVPESKVKAYRKLFKKKGISDGATITK